MKIQDIIQEMVSNFDDGRKRLRNTEFGDQRRAKNKGKIPIGYQVGDIEGYSIQGDEEDPTGLFSYQILDEETADFIKKKYNVSMVPIYDDDIEKPEFITMKTLHKFNINKVPKT